MKTAFLALAFAAASFTAAAQLQPAAKAAAANAQPAAADAYQQRMLAAIADQGTGKTAEEMQANATAFEHAAAAAPAAWEPRYYQARAYLKKGQLTKESGPKDQALDQAQAALDQAAKLPGADRAEILLVQASIYQGQLMAAPATRGEEYSAKVSETLKQVKALAPGNPRLYLLLGNDVYYCPPAYGGGPDKAKPLYEQAKALFASYKPATALSPVWGEKNIDAMLAKINGASASLK